MLKYPVIGLSPMDGVTDVVFRQIVDQCSHPDILYTEFIPVDGLVLQRPTIIQMLNSHKTTTPVIVQLFGSNPDLFYQSVKILSQYNFIGIDINMGCPDNKVIKKGGGAALINNPDLAKKIILSVKQGIKDFCKQPLLVTLKTRTGYHQPNTHQWISELLEASPDIITVHGRTFDQVYTGKADWSEIEKAVILAKNTKTKIFGNGDIRSIDEAKNAIEKYKVDGVLIGRAALGNPWIFSNHQPTIKGKLTIIQTHCQLFNQYFPKGNFKSLRKHFVWYAKSLPRATDLKEQLMKANTSQEVNKIISDYLKISIKQ